VNRRQFFTRTAGVIAAVAVAPHIPAPPTEFVPLTVTSEYGEGYQFIDYGYSFEVTNTASYDGYQPGDVARRLAETARRIQATHAISAFTVSR
jgi:hypothetical protein